MYSHFEYAPSHSAHQREKMMSLPSNPVSKYAKIDGNTDAGMAGFGTSIPRNMPQFAESRVDFNSGNTVNPKVDVKHFYPVSGDQDWSKLVSINTPVFAKNDESVKFPKTSLLGRNQIHASIVMDPIHLNHHMATEFINGVNAKVIDFLKRNPQMNQVHLDELYDPIEILNEVACKWKLAGINIVAAPAGPMYGDAPSSHERCIAARIRGMQMVKNYWDCSIHGGYSCFFVLKFMVLRNIMRPFYKFDETSGAQAPEFHSAIKADHWYIPQLVAMYDINNFLPLKELKFSMHYRPAWNGEEMRTFTGVPFYMGMCFYNPKFKRTSRDVPIKNIPVTSGLVVDARYPMHVQALMF